MIKLTDEEQAQTLADYMPGGKPFAKKNVTTSRIRALLRGLSKEIKRADDYLEIFRTDIVPDAVGFYLDDWERAVGIPDDAFDGTGSIEERHLHVLLKLVYMNLQTAQSYVDLAGALGLAITVESGSVHGAFPFVFPIKFYPDARAAHHTIIIRYTYPDAITFPYTFPIQFTTPELTLLELIFSKLKPANCDLIFEGSP